MHDMNVMSNHPTMSSVEIAELTGKQHKHVKADIVKLLNESELNSAGFSEYLKNKQNQSVLVYNLPMHYTVQLISKYNSRIIVDLIQTLPTQYVKNVVDLINNMDIEDLPVDRFVYVAQESENGRIKVGISKNPEQRIKQLNVGNPEELKLVAIFKANNDGYESEALMHRKLKKYAIRSEWFKNDAMSLIN